MKRYVDLSHTISDGLVTYKGLPAPLICDYLTREASRDLYEEGTSFSIASINMVGNTGTYMDCPYHRFEDGRDFNEFFISDMADLPGLKVSVPYEDRLSVGPDLFEELDLKGKAILIETGWSRHWNTERYFEHHPFLTREAAEYLRQHEVKLVGIDSYNIDNTGSNARPAHTILLGANILIVEHLCQLHLVPSHDFLFSALPPKIRGMGSFPVRAFAKF